MGRGSHTAGREVGSDLLSWRTVGSHTGPSCPHHAPSTDDDQLMGWGGGHLHREGPGVGSLCGLSHKDKWARRQHKDIPGREEREELSKSQMPSMAEGRTI